MADRPPYPGAPRWVKIAGIVAAILALLLALLLLLAGGQHGPGRHLATDRAGGQAPAAEGDWN
jgi:hypothetical protein